MPSPISHLYTAWSPQYDDNHNLTRDLDAVVLRSAPIEVTGRDVLEIGCGTGKNTVWLAERARSVVAIDFSEGMLELARRRVTQQSVQFVQHDLLEPWPLASACVDVVVGDLVLEHVEHLEPVFHEAARVLRPGGMLFLSELHPYRQLRGVQARFEDPDTKETVLVPAYAHSTSEFVNTGIAAGFALRALGEWTEPAAEPDAPPRLLSMIFDKA